ncbi:hypothetical protein [Neobacillus vireti]|uniref:Uncharacterized protein n=1 Tax=Neobacillus vireti LMG 21834 TaxID=1131730 RepID=A0AB94IJP0_9BACI|nr:hypothetical protein [Neobacillus vireti]ETI67223.1 hypothetical protein BAVI_18582 [Neobacillus vireti LMG 21834]KLT17913.1 hypothetical protein AA980_12610 [Neobacillus vireti]
MVAATEILIKDSTTITILTIITRIFILITIQALIIHSIHILGMKMVMAMAMVLITILITINFKTKKRGLG